jgi:hypothetical protein
MLGGAVWNCAGCSNPVVPPGCCGDVDCQDCFANEAAVCSLVEGTACTAGSPNLYYRSGSSQLAGNCGNVEVCTAFECVCE